MPRAVPRSRSTTAPAPARPRQAAQFKKAKTKVERAVRGRPRQWATAQRARAVTSRRDPCAPPAPPSSASASARSRSGAPGPGRAAAAFARPSARRTRRHRSRWPACAVAEVPGGSCRRGAADGADASAPRGGPLPPREGVGGRRERPPAPHPSRREFVAWSSVLSGAVSGAALGAPGASA